MKRSRLIGQTICTMECKLQTHFVAPTEIPAIYYLAALFCPIYKDFECRFATCTSRKFYLAHMTFIQTVPSRDTDF